MEHAYKMNKQRSYKEKTGASWRKARRARLYIPMQTWFELCLKLRLSARKPQPVKSKCVRKRKNIQTDRWIFQLVRLVVPSLNSVVSMRQQCGQVSSSLHGQRGAQGDECPDNYIQHAHPFIALLVVVVSLLFL